MNLLVYSVSREDVESLNMKGVNHFIFSLNKLKNQAFQSACIFIDGYDDTPDELYEIEEVRIFIKKVIEKFPHLLYFLSPQMEAHIYVLGCLADTSALLIQEGAKLSPKEEWQKGKTGTENRMEVKIQLHEEWYQRMVQGVRNFAGICKDPIGIKKTLDILDYFRSKGKDQTDDEDDLPIKGQFGSFSGIFRKRR